MRGDAVETFPFNARNRVASNDSLSVIWEIESSQALVEGMPTTVYGTTHKGSTTDGIAGDHEEDDGKLGLTSTVFLTLNRMLGSEVFCLTSGVFALAGSGGTAMFLWALGALLVAAGVSAYLELGLAMPFTGGEKNYLERAYKRPQFLLTCVFLAHTVLLGLSCTSGLAFAHYFVEMIWGELNEWAFRGVAIGVIALICALQSVVPPRLLLRIISGMGILNVFALLLVVGSGLLCWTGHLQRHEVSESFPQIEIARTPGSHPGSSSYALALLRIMITYRGWSTPTEIASSLHQPRRTMALGMPISAIVGILLTIFANMSFIAVLPATTLETSGIYTAAIYWRTLFPGEARLVLPIMVAIANVSHILSNSVVYASFMVPEFAKDGLLPRGFIMRNSGLVLYVLVSSVALLTAPSYAFLADLVSFPASFITVIVAIGLSRLQRNLNGVWSSFWHCFRPVLIVLASAHALIVIGVMASTGCIAAASALVVMVLGVGWWAFLKYMRGT